MPDVVLFVSPEEQAEVERVITAKLEKTGGRLHWLVPGLAHLVGGPAGLGAASLGRDLARYRFILGMISSVHASPGWRTLFSDEDGTGGRPGHVKHYLVIHSGGRGADNTRAMARDTRPLTDRAMFVFAPAAGEAAFGSDLLTAVSTYSKEFLVARFRYVTGTVRLRELGKDAG
ncbi:MAG: hypothetical protein ABR517_02980 [Thermoanaerobaculia bacterium]